MDLWEISLIGGNYIISCIHMSYGSDSNCRKGFQLKWTMKRREHSQRTYSPIADHVEGMECIAIIEAKHSDSVSQVSYWRIGNNEATLAQW